MQIADDQSKIGGGTEAVSPDFSRQMTVKSQSQIIQAVQDIAFGSSAGIIGKYVEYPFDTVKVRLQSQPDRRPPLYSGPIDCFRQSIKADGLGSLYRGVSAPLIGAAIENSCLFLSYRICQGILQKSFYSSKEGTNTTLPLGALAVAGAGSGAFTSLVLTPVELIKCKMQVPSVAGPVTKRGLLTTIAMILKHRGIAGFWHGQLGTLIRETGGSAAWFGGYEGVGLIFKKRNQAQGSPDGYISIPQQLTAGAVAGVSYNISFYPADTIKSRMQTEDVSVKASDNRRTFWAAGRELWREHGMKGLYRGCGITALRAAPSSALVFTIYEGLKAHFK